MKHAIAIFLLPAALALPGHSGRFYGTGQAYNASGDYPTSAQSSNVAAECLIPTSSTAATPAAAIATDSANVVPITTFITIQTTIFYTSIVKVTSTSTVELTTTTGPTSDAGEAWDTATTSDAADLPSATTADADLTAAGTDIPCVTTTTVTVDTTITVTTTDDEASVAAATSWVAVSSTTLTVSPVPWSSTAAPAWSNSSVSSSAVAGDLTPSDTGSPVPAGQSPSESGSAVVAASTATSSTTPTPSSSSSSGKRGLIMPAGGADTPALVAAFNNEPKIVWTGNWYSSPPPDISANIEFVPQCYHFDDADFDPWNQNAKNAISLGDPYFLSFGEPETDPGADTVAGAQAAAQGYMKFLQPYADSVTIGAPGVLQNTNDFTWLSEFLTACDALGCKIGFIAIHWFWEATEIDSFKATVTNATTIANGKPVWVDNFQATGTNDQQQAFLADVVPWMEANDAIQRYAYVSPDRTTGTGVLNADGSISSLGTFYANL